MGRDSSPGAFSGELTAPRASTLMALSDVETVDEIDDEKWRNFSGRCASFSAMWCGVIDSRKDARRDSRARRDGGAEA